MIVAEETSLVKKTRNYATGILEKEMPSHICYHDLRHTEDVVDACYIIGQYHQLSDQEMETLLLAAWLHDTGYYNGNAMDHEEESANIARKFLKGENISAERISKVTAIILATKIPHHPQTLLEKIICDADLYHLASDSYFEKSAQLKKEFEKTKAMTTDDLQWYEMNLEFFKQHQFFTKYGKEVLAPRKEENFKKIKKAIQNGNTEVLKIKHKEKELKEPITVEQLHSEVRKLKKKKKKDRNIPTRGIETMFRITSKNHLTLSGMADNKANIMISINSIILSILMTVLTRKFEDFPNLIIPALILTITSLLTIVFAVLATRPNISSGKFTTEDIINKRTNLLFFGNFHGMHLQEYEWGMKEMMKDSDYLYSSMIRDIFFLGIVLGKKYRLLRLSYTVFMYGFVVAILSFVIASFFPHVSLIKFW